MKLISTHLKNMKVILDGIEWICDDVEVLQTCILNLLILPLHLFSLTKEFPCFLMS
jgi:hypothetical protein